MKIEKVIYLLIFCLFFISCKSTNIYDNRAGTTDYRELQSEIRDGETKLVITNKDIESTNNRIEERISDIESTGSNLEQSITESERSEQEIGELIQSIRNRPIPSDKLIELGFE